MKKYFLFLIFFFVVCLLFANGNKDICNLIIENQTGTHVTQIIINETETKNEVQKITKNMENGISNTVQVKKNILLDIILINTDNRQYAKNRQVFETDKAAIIVTRQDLQNQNFWDKAKNLIDAGVPVLQETGRVISKAVTDAYDKLKNDDKLKQTIDIVKTHTEALLKTGAEFFVEKGKLVIKASKEAIEKFKEDLNKNLSNEDKKLIDEYVEFIVIDA
jgi:hypothetical protein